MESKEGRIEMRTRRGNFGYERLCCLKINGQFYSNSPALPQLLPTDSHCTITCLNTPILYVFAEAFGPLKRGDDTRCRDWGFRREREGKAERRNLESYFSKSEWMLEE